ncbi:phenol 2-monooxygenase [Nocardia sp. CA2R105]|uniref:phenol 2-monooxygenase n=1 Tax=Nocardia coffeae TaxID=2873381 RepID=UPI001CA63B4B|nr:phenol 2-monooxygenase [Nocardia coffeae]MBY8859354.1 phenol 2-monooxygenase [Nocardia coffeae]
MQYELRYQVIEPKRQTYQNVIDRLGDQPASRYLEGTLDVQPRENFHYRPTWARDRELYDARFSALRLTDGYAFLDPRQYYYTPYVTHRAGLHDEFGKTLSYLEERDLLAKLPEPWHDLVSSVVIPLRHYESGAQLTSVAGARFADGTSIEQCCTFAAFDRIGNAQMLSRVGIAVGGGTAQTLQAAKQHWLEAEHLQPLRRLIEEIMIVDDWAEGILAVDLVDRLLYPLVYRDLDETALLGGAGAYSLYAQYLWTWFTDQRKWLDALIGVWTADEQHGTANRQELNRISRVWAPRAADAVGALASAIDTRVPEAGAAERLAAAVDAQRTRWTEITGGEQA